MKKIKVLLGIGLLCALFSTCFSVYQGFYAVEYFDSYNQHQNFIFNGFNPSGTFNFMSANGGTFSSLASVMKLGTGVRDNTSLDFSNYTLTSDYSSFSSQNNSYLYVSGNDIALQFNSPNNSYKFNFLFNISNSISDVNNLYLQNSGVYIRVLTNDGDGIIIDNPFIQSVSPSGVRSWIFQINSVRDTDRGVVYDTLSDGVMYNRGVISPGVGDQYSFTVSPEFIPNTGGSTLTINPDSIPYLFRTVSPTFQGDYVAHNGIFVIKLDSLYRKTNTGDFRILVISLTGNSFSNEPLYDFIYSRYSCPSDSFSLFSCSYVDGGYLRSSSLSNSFRDNNGVLYNLTGLYYSQYSANVMQNFLTFLTLPSYFYNVSTYYISPTIYSVESNNVVELYRPTLYRSSRQGAYTYNVENYSLGLSQSAGINILEDYQGGGSASFSGGASLGFDCVMTEVCWFSTGADGNVYSYCGNTCVDSGVVESGSFIGSDGTVYFVNSSVDIEDLLKTHNASSLFDGSYIDEDGILSPDYFSGFFTPGSYKIGVCPYNYYEGPLDFLSEVKVGDLYIFKPILCYYSAFQEGRSVKYFDDYEIFPPEISSQLINGDSDNHKLLYRFFDILFSIGLLGLIRRLSRHIF